MVFKKHFCLVFTLGYFNFTGVGWNLAFRIFQTFPGNLMCDKVLKQVLCCIGFAIHQHESATGVHMFPFLNPPPTSLLYHPSGSSQCTSPKHPVSFIEPGLTIHFLYDIIHVSMSFFQIIPPSPSPRVQKTVLYICVERNDKWLTKIIIIKKKKTDKNK